MVLGTYRAHGLASPVTNSFYAGQRIVRRSVGGILVYFRRTPHPVIVTIRDRKDYITVLFYSYYTTITGWGVLLKYTVYSVL